MIAVSAPGKLVIAGEWAVLEGHPAIVAAINRRVRSFVEPLEGQFVSLTMDDFKVRDARFVWKDGALHPFKNGGADARFARAAMEAALSFLDREGIAFRPFKLRSSGEGFQEGKKFGFGSSAAATAAIVDSVLRFHGRDAEKDIVFKLAALAHYRAQGSAGSGVDIAASVYGGVLAYRRFDPGVLGKGQALMKTWRGLSVKKLPFPDGLRLMVVWSGTEASTPLLMRAMNEYKTRNRREYERTLEEIGTVVSELADVWNDGDEDAIIRLLKKNAALLGELTRRSGVPVETLPFKRLAAIAEQEGAAGKLSGAGGGDCGIVVCRKKDAVRMSSVLAANFTLVNVHAEQDGVRNEEPAPC